MTSNSDSEINMYFNILFDFISQKHQTCNKSHLICLDGRFETNVKHVEIFYDKIILFVDS